LASAVVPLFADTARAQWSPIDLNPLITGVSDIAVAYGGSGPRLVGYANLQSNTTYATMWVLGSGAPTWVNLNPVGASGSIAYGASGMTQAGQATFGNATHAGRWSGTAASWVDLNPAGASGSSASCIAGTQQAGKATFGNGTHAGLWSGTAASWVDLNPAASAASQVNGTSGTQQVGQATFSGITHAGLWNGTAASWIDLNPSGAASSIAYGTTGTRQVGYANTGPSQAAHAGMWSGTAASWIDLNPPGATSSAAYATYGEYQVGFARFSDGRGWPGVWRGTAASWEPLPLNYDDEAWNLYGFPNGATSIWLDGSQLRIAGFVAESHYVSTVGNNHALMWSRIPLGCGST
jgi:hypothetical protein